MTTSDDIKAAAAGETAPGTMSEASVTDDHIKAALAKLDPANDAHWTASGDPAMEAVNALLTASITRKRLEEVAPDFKRPLASEAAPTPPEPFGGNGDHDENGSTGGAAPPVDNDHVAAGASPFTADEVGSNQGGAAPPTAPAPEEDHLYSEEAMAAPSVEDRLAALEADNAFLRNQFGWPTKGDAG